MVRATFVPSHILDKNRLQYSVQLSAEEPGLVHYASIHPTYSVYTEPLRDGQDLCCVLYEFRQNVWMSVSLR